MLSTNFDEFFYEKVACMTSNSDSISVVHGYTARHIATSGAPRRQYD